MTTVMSSSRSCRDTAFDPCLSHVDSRFAADAPRHDPGNVFRLIKPIESKNGPIWNQFAFMEGEIALFHLLGLAPIMPRSKS